MRTERFDRRTKRRTDTRENRGGFLFLTLAQCALCAAMLAMAYFASDLLGMTGFRPVFARLLTQQTDRQEVETCLQVLWEGAQELPQNVLQGRPTLFAPMAQAVSGHISSGYGYREDPFTGERDFHTGVDIAAPAGSPIAAVYPGVVETVAVSAAYGNYAVVRHENFSTRYCHCDCVLAREGDRVAAGETIALVGSTGNSTGPHLHLELIVDGKNADPSGEMRDWAWV